MPPKLVVQVALLFLITPLLACAPPNQRGPRVTGAPPPDPTTQRQLRERALRLLRHATLSDEPAIVSNAIEALAEVDPTTSEDAFRRALTNESPLVRYSGAVALGETRARRSIDRIVPLLRDADARVRLGAAFACYRLGRKQAARILIDALNNAADERVRAEAAWLLGKLGQPRAVTQLNYAAAREESSYVAVHIDSALALLGNNQARERVIEYSLKSDTVTITLAMQTLIELKTPAAREALQYRLYDPATYLTVQLLAARALGALGSQEGFDHALKHLNHVVDHERMSDDERAAATTQVRVAAATALGEMRSARALEALRAVAENETEPRIQIAAAWAIVTIVDAQQDALLRAPAR